MANITIGNTGETFPVEITGDGEHSVASKCAKGIAMGEYTVVAKEGWNIANNGDDYRPEIKAVPEAGVDWMPERLATKTISVTDTSGVTRKVEPCTGLQMKAGKFTVGVAD